MADHEIHPLTLPRPRLGAGETTRFGGWTDEGDETTAVWDTHRQTCRLILGECLRRHVSVVIIVRDGDPPGGDVREQAEAEFMRGVLAQRQGDSGHAARHYSTAAGLFDTVGDPKAVGHTLAALGMVNMEIDPSAALASLQAAAARLPGDPAVQTAIGTALWRAGRPHAALAILDAVLSRRGPYPEAKRIKGEILAKYPSKRT